MLYPLKFKPLFKDKIWGGQKIRTSLGMDFSPLPNCGEAWVLSGVPGSETVVSNGFLAGNDLNELLEVYMDELVGEMVFDRFPDEFPILVKFIDAMEWLSIQVHPDDELAARQKTGKGKTEMWYVLDAGPDAKLISGFNRPADKTVYLDHLRQKRLTELLNFEQVGRGDVFYIPSGCVHALGPGILLAEIQQTSDTTYRIYDWDRVDAQGKSRELHTDLALGAIRFEDPDAGRIRYKSRPNLPVTLVDCPHFRTSHVEVTQTIGKDYSGLDSFVICLAVEGRALIESEGNRTTLAAGEVLLLPALTEEIRIIPEPGLKFLEVFIP